MNLEFMLTRFVQFVMLSCYVFVTFVYAGLIVLIPLALLFGSINFLDHTVGLYSFLAVIFSFGFVTWLVIRIRRIPGLTVTLLGTGWSLVKMAAENFKHFDDLAGSLRPSKQGKPETVIRP